MLLKKILLLFFIIICFATNAQVFLEESNHNSGERYKIEINENSEKYFLELKVIEIVTYSKKDKRKYDIFMKSLPKLSTLKENKEEFSATLMKLKEITDRSENYSISNIIITKSDHQDYKNLLDAIKSTSKEDLERNNSPKTITLDGSFLSIIILENGVTQKFEVNYPNEKSHALLYSFFKQSRDLFQNKRSNFKPKRIAVNLKNFEINI